MLSLSFSPNLSLHAVVVDAVRIAAAAAVVDGGQQQGRGREVAVGVAATAATHRVKRGRTRTRRDKEITTVNGDTIERWAKQGGPASRWTIVITLSMAFVSIVHDSIVWTS